MSMFNSMITALIGFLNSFDVRKQLVWLLFCSNDTQQPFNHQRYSDYGML